jgi:hypothetical protein
MMQYWDGEGNEITHQEFDERLGRETPTLLNIRDDPDLQRMLDAGNVIYDEGCKVADEAAQMFEDAMMPPSKDVRLTDNLTFMMLAVFITAAVSFVLGVAVGAVMWMFV